MKYAIWARSLLAVCVRVEEGKLLKLKEKNLEPQTFQKLHTFHYMRVRMIHLNLKP